MRYLVFTLQCAARHVVACTTAGAFEFGVSKSADAGRKRGSVRIMRPGGLEPPTHSLEGCCSIRLSYERGMSG